MIVYENFRRESNPLHFVYETNTLPYELRSNTNLDVDCKYSILKINLQIIF